MATRSHIGVKNTDGTVDYIYCHFDGYPEHNGKILTEHYQDMDRVNALMKLGNLSSLAEEIGEKHNFDNRVRNWCHAYGRDREETDQSVGTAKITDLLTDDNVDYVYIFDGEFWDCYSPSRRTAINIYSSN
jgi:hypothetical protein